jgi:HK97 family phage major capsid protein
VSPIRAIAAVRPSPGSVYKKLFMTSGPAVGWVGETDVHTQTASPTLDELSFPAMELYAMAAATATLLEDSAVNIDQWLAQKVEQVCAAQEGTAFVTGDGSNKPKGFLSYTTVANASWTWGNVGYIASGAAGAFPSSNPSDVLVDLVYAVKAGYRQNAVLVMNRKTQSAVRKIKDSTGSCLWQPPTIAGGKASLMTFPVTEAEDMPDVAANSLSIAFGRPRGHRSLWRRPLRGGSSKQLRLQRRPASRRRGNDDFQIRSRDIQADVRSTARSLIPTFAPYPRSTRDRAIAA